MLLELTGVLRDGSEPAGTAQPLVPFVQDVSWPRAEDGTVEITVKKEDGTAANLSGCAIILGVRRHSNDAAALISRQADIPAPASGLANVAIVKADTIDLHDETKYHFSVELTDASGKRWQLIPWSGFTIEPIASYPTDPITVPAAATPLGLGPSWGQWKQELPAESDGSASELLIDEFAWNFDTIAGGLPNLFLELNFLGMVSAGTGIVRVRCGGTADQPDGTVLIQSDAVDDLASTIQFKTATVAAPSGRQRVKVTIQGASGNKLFVSGGTLFARGAP